MEVVAENSGVAAYKVDTAPWGFEGVTSALIVARGSRGFIVDPGFMVNLEQVLVAASTLGVRLEAVLLTHIHLDHGGCAVALAHYLGVPIYVHPRGARHLAWPAKLWEAAQEVIGPDAVASLKPLPGDLEGIHTTSDGEVEYVAGIEVEFIHTPGHAPHHQSVHVPQLKLIHTGDSMGLIYGSCVVPVTPPPFKPYEYLRSVGKQLEREPKVLQPTHYDSHWEPREAAKQLVDRLLLYRELGDPKAVLEADECSRMVAERRSRVPYFRGEVERSVRGVTSTSAWPSRGEAYRLAGLE